MTTHDGRPGDEHPKDRPEDRPGDSPEEAPPPRRPEGEDPTGEDPARRLSFEDLLAAIDETQSDSEPTTAESPEDDTDDQPRDAAADNRPDRDIFGRTPKHAPDWSHRRGEPRVFVLLWTIYLMFCAAAMFARSGGMVAFDPVAFRPSARMGLLMMMVGVGLLWPLMRLSQAMPREGGVRATLKDAGIIIVTGHALILPQLWLARWDGQVVLALSVLFVLWTLLTGAVIACTQGPPTAGEEGEPRTGTRAAGVLCCLALVLSGGLVALADAGRAPGADAIASRPARMLSPMTAIYEIARDRPWTGRAAMIGPAHRASLGATALAAAGAWGVALVACRRRRNET